MKVCFARNCAEKSRHYRQEIVEGRDLPEGVEISVVPFVLTPGGGICNEASDFLHKCMVSAGSVRHQVRFRNFVRTRLAILLLNHVQSSTARCPVRRCAL